MTKIGTEAHLDTPNQWSNYGSAGPTATGPQSIWGPENKVRQESFVKKIPLVKGPQAKGTPTVRAQNQTAEVQSIWGPEKTFRQGKREWRNAKYKKTTRWIFTKFGMKALQATLNP